MRTPAPLSSAKAPILLLVPLLLFAYWLYLPGLAGGFIFDDGGSITENEWIQIDRLTIANLEGAAHSFRGSPLGRPVAMVTFALDHLLAGLDPVQFKRTNLLIHLFNGGLVFLLSWLALQAFRRRIPGAATSARIGWVALLVAALWLLHPLALTSVLYVVQRMASLSALFSLLALVLYLWGRLRMIDGRGGWPAVLAAFGVAMPLAVLSKESGLLAPLFVLLAEWLLLGFRCADGRCRRRLKWLFALFVGLPALGALFYLALHPGWIVGGYAGRPFTLEERVMTEGRVLWFYLRLILLPSLSAMGIFHDDIPISRGLFDPLTTLPALLALLSLVVGALWLRRRAAPFAFGVLFFLGGHLMESTVFPLEIAHEHRNYLPMFGILLVVGYYLTHPGVPAKGVRVAATVVLTLALAGVTWGRVGQWSDPLKQWVAEAAFHPASPSAQFEAGRTYFFLYQKGAEGHSRPQLAALARRHFSLSHELDPDYLAGLFGNLLLADELGVAPDPAEVERLVERLASRPVSSGSVNLLHQLSRCRLSGECGIGMSVVRRLYRAALSNPALGGHGRSMLLSEAMVHALMANDPEQALKYASEALAHDRRTPQYWLNYVNLLTRMNRLDEAERLLEAFKHTRMARWVEGRVALQERLLNEARDR